MYIVDLVSPFINCRFVFFSKCLMTGLVINQILAHIPVLIYVLALWYLSSFSKTMICQRRCLISNLNIMTSKEFLLIT